MEFKNSYSLITGGSRGIGLAIAQMLAEEGGNLVLLARSMSELKEAKKLLEDKYEVEVTVYAGDISDLQDLKQVIAKMVDGGINKIDFLINNAGINSHQSLDIEDEDTFATEIDVNLKGTFYVIKQVIPLLNKGGAILNISSERGRAGSRDTSPGYAAAKAGIINLTKTCAYQLAKYGVRVNCIAPGPVTDTLMSVAYTNNKIKEMTAENPLGRLADPQDIAKAARFLLSDESAYITGQTLDVNGGSNMN